MQLHGNCVPLTHPCRPADGGLGVFGHFSNILLRPMLALDLATSTHLDRSQPATLMCFAAPFAVPADIDAALHVMPRGMYSDRKNAVWLQVGFAVGQGMGLGPGVITGCHVMQGCAPWGCCCFLVVTAATGFQCDADNSALHDVILPVPTHRPATSGISGGCSTRRQLPAGMPRQLAAPVLPTAHPQQPLRPPRAPWVVAACSPC